MRWPADLHEAHVSNRLLRLSAVVALALMAACSSDGGATTTSPTVEVEDSGNEASPSTTTTVPVDQIPDEITVEYVQRVMDSLDAAWGDMFRQYKAEKGPTPDNLAWLGELYTEPLANDMEQELGTVAGDMFDAIRDEPGDPSTQVEQVLAASEACISLLAQRSYEAVFVADPGDETESTLVELRPARPESDRNPTAWSISREDSLQAGDTPSDSCDE